MNRKTWLALAAAAVVLVGFLAFGTWRCMGWMVDQRMAQGNLWSSATWSKLLNLTKEQRAKIRPMEKDLKTDMGRLQNELAQKQIALCQLMMSPGQPDRKALDQTLDEVSALQKQKEEKTLDHLMSLREVLTPEQQKTLFSTMMMDICQGCRQATGTQKDHCGHCKL
jgi:Spy/CpxP family protein refolding chaperone